MLAKRNKEFTVEEISNGFLVKYSGRDTHDDWASETLYVHDVDAVENFIEKWVAIPKEN